MTSGEAKPIRVRIPCLRCDNATWHVVVASAVRAGGGEDEPQYEEAFQVVKCQGCDELSFRRAARDQTDNWESEYEELYPGRAVGRRELPSSWLLPNAVRQIYRETYSASCNKMPTLTAIGIRALVESVCKEKGAQGNNLEQRIDDLVVKGVLTRSGGDILHKTRFLGNAAAHEIETPKPEALAAAMSVAEHLLQTVYLLKSVADRLPSS